MTTVYRITREVRIPHIGHWKVGAHCVTLVTSRDLVALLRHERENRYPPLKTIRIEQAGLSPFTDVTKEWLDGHQQGDQA
jgi:hypothetical protein